MGSHSPETCNVSETEQDMTKVTIDDQKKVTYALSIGAKINDHGWPWSAITHRVSKHVRLSESTTKICMKVDYTISDDDEAQWLYILAI